MRPFAGPRGFGLVGVVGVLVVGVLVVGSGAVGRVAADVVVATVVGVVTGTVAGVVEKSLPLSAVPRSVSTIAVVAPGIATRSVRSESHPQSPGYQPTRRIQRRRSDGIRPVTAG